MHYSRAASRGRFPEARRCAKREDIEFHEARKASFSGALSFPQSENPRNCIWVGRCREGCCSVVKVCLRVRRTRTQRIAHRASRVEEGKCGSCPLNPAGRAPVSKELFSTVIPVTLPHSGRSCLFPQRPVGRGRRSDRGGSRSRRLLPAQTQLNRAFRGPVEAVLPYSRLIGGRPPGKIDPRPQLLGHAVYYCRIRRNTVK